MKCWNCGNKKIIETLGVCDSEPCLNAIIVGKMRRYVRGDEDLMLLMGNAIDAKVASALASITFDNERLKPKQLQAVHNKYRNTIEKLYTEIGTLGVKITKLEGKLHKVRNPPKKPRKHYRDKHIWKDCIFCGETFHKKNPNHRACSKKCQRKWHNVTTMVKKYMGN